MYRKNRRRGREACTPVQKNQGLRSRTVISFDVDLSTDDGRMTKDTVETAVAASLEYFRIRRGEVSVLIVGDEKIHELNRIHRGVDRPTDVLSFPQYQNRMEWSSEKSPYFGDVVISYPTAVRQAEEYGHSLRRELAYLTVHSVLHLLGYDHEEEKEKMMMRFVEKEIMVVLRLFKSK